MNRRLILLVFCLLVSPLLHAGESVVDSARIYYRLGYRYVDTSLRGNGEVLKNLCAKIEKALQEDLLEKVVIYSYTSPDGTHKANLTLAARRMDSLESWLLRNTPLPATMLETNSGGIAWDLLRDAVSKSEMQYKKEVLQILDNTPVWVFDSNGKVIGSRKKELMDLKGGVPYRYMYEHLFPDLRSSIAIMLYVRTSGLQTEEEREPAASEKTSPAAPEKDMVTTVPEESAIPATEESETVVPDEKTTAVIPEKDMVTTVPEESVTPAAEKSEAVAPDEKATAAVPEQERYEPLHKLALKTNMLYDVLAVPNIGVEFYLGKNWSISGNWMYGWWNSDSKHRYWRIYGGEIAVRKWLGKKASEKPLTGHHLGVYGQLFTYDFEWNGTGYMGGEPGKSLWNSPNYAAGVEYGYSLPIGRRLNIDFTVGVGYWGGTYYTYTPLDGHYVWEATKKRHWFGPTKAEISLVWLLGRGNSNNWKGGLK